LALNPIVEETCKFMAKPYIPVNNFYLEMEGPKSELCLI